MIGTAPVPHPRLQIGPRYCDADEIAVLVEVGAAQKISAGAADKLAAAVFQARRAGRAEAGMMLVSDGALRIGRRFDQVWR
jgi:hypothetical protein